MDKDKFPQGLRTEIESAGNVSGGEKQVSLQYGIYGYGNILWLLFHIIQTPGLHLAFVLAHCYCTCHPGQSTDPAS